MNIYLKLTEFLYSLDFMRPPWNGSLKWWMVSKTIGKVINVIIGAFK